MNEQEVVGYSVYVGIDWSDSKHDVCIQSKISALREFAVIRHRAEAIDAWVKDCGGTVKVIVSIEDLAVIKQILERLEKRLNQKN